jgi:radical SAM superfamily enzyme YgiQ (UPF0313 family)
MEKDLRHLLRSRRPREVFFTDAFLDVDQIRHVLDLLAGQASGPRVSCFTRFDERLSDVAAARALRRAGLTDLYVGLESASPRVLELMQKGTDLALASGNLHTLHAAGVAVHLSCILGFPTETAVEVRKTLAFLQDHRAVLDARPVVFPFTLDPGTPMAQAPAAWAITSRHPTQDAFGPSVRTGSEGGMTLQEQDALLAEANSLLEALYPASPACPAHPP